MSLQVRNMVAESMQQVSVNMINWTTENFVSSNAGNIVDQVFQLKQSTTQDSIKTLTLTGEGAKTYVYGFSSDKEQISLASTTAFGGIVGMAEHFAQDATGNFQRVSDVPVSVTIIGDDGATTVKKCEAVHEFYLYDNSVEVSQELSRIAFINMTGGLTSVSDKRLKEDIKPISGLLASLDNINTYTFFMKGKRDLQVGFLGQEILENFPLATNYTFQNEKDVEAMKEQSKTIFVDYGKMSVYNLQIQKELKQHIVEQQKKIDAQAVEIEKQKKKIEEQQRQIDEIVKVLASLKTG